MVEFHVTFPDPDSAAAAARQALEQRLAACANIVPAIRSLYWWQGRIETETEALAILKTGAGKADALARFLEDIHPYDTPAIIRHDNVTANPSYLGWIAAETGTDAAQ